MSPLKVFNTLSASKEEFVPLNGKRVLMYACGPTVYDLSHLGHARMALTFDIIVRYLRFSGYDVTFVRNITDVDDKIINRAREVGITPERLARQYIYTFWRDMDNLNTLPPDHEPRATEFIQQMIAYAQALIEKGHAYESHGDVYFDVASFKQYGRLKKQSIEDLLVGARDQVRSQEELKEIKRSPVDFALWKSVKNADELSWPSPWGNGRPGWHLECSTMIKHVLGETIDIHGGGEDLVFPHHDNEIAQAETMHDKPFARYWLHNSFVQVEAEKMSKSLGNFRTIDDVLRQYSPDTVRMFVLQTHYRTPIEFTTDSMNAARTAVSRLIKAAGPVITDTNGALAASNEALPPLSTLLASGDADIKQWHADFVEAMDNDFNTPIAVSVLFAIADKATHCPDASVQANYRALLRHLSYVLGLTLSDTTRQVDSMTGGSVLDLVMELRAKARANKDYASSDLIRDHLQKLGIKVMDGKDGATWERS